MCYKDWMRISNYKGMEKICLPNLILGRHELIKCVTFVHAPLNLYPHMYNTRQPAFVGLSWQHTSLKDLNHLNSHITVFFYKSRLHMLHINEM